MTSVTRLLSVSLLPLAVAAPTSDWRLVLLTDAAAKAGAVCLDGSPGGYYIRHGDPERWVVFLEGGELCASEHDCAQLALSPQGSSSFWSAEREESYSDAASLFSDRAFANHTAVFFKACDGSAATGDLTAPVHTHKPGEGEAPTIYYRGARLLPALFEQLLGAGLWNASSLLFAGCSTGALSAYLWADRVFEWLAPHSVAVLTLGDGMFALDSSRYDGTPGTFELTARWGYEAWNASGALPSACVAEQAAAGAEPWRCLFGATAARHVTSGAVFHLGSRFDVWQGDEIIGANTTIGGDLSRPVLEFWEAYAARMAVMVAALPGAQSAFLTNCPAHCQTGSAFKDPWSRGAWDGTTLGGTAA
eukprot:gene9104-4137_t